MYDTYHYKYFRFFSQNWEVTLTPANTYKCAFWFYVPPVFRYNLHQLKGYWNSWLDLQNVWRHHSATLHCIALQFWSSRCLKFLRPSELSSWKVRCLASLSSSERVCVQRVLFVCFRRIERLKTSPGETSIFTFDELSTSDPTDHLNLI